LKSNLISSFATFKILGTQAFLNFCFTASISSRVDL